MRDAAKLLLQSAARGEGVAHGNRFFSLRQIRASRTNKRVGLILFPPVGGTAVLSNEPTVSGNNGITLQQSGAPVHLYAEQCGDAVQKEWYVIYSAGASVMGWIEVLY